MLSIHIVLEWTFDISSQKSVDLDAEVKVTNKPLLIGMLTVEIGPDGVKVKQKNRPRRAYTILG